MSAESRAAEVMAEHYGAGADLTTPRQYTARGGWNISCTCGAGIGETGDDDIEQRHRAHVAAALAAAGCLADDREGETVAAEMQARAEALDVAAMLLGRVVDYWDGRPLAGHGEHIYNDLRDALAGIKRDADHNRTRRVPVTPDGGDQP